MLKRLYRLAGIAGARFLRRRALKDALSNPELAERVCDYMRTSGSDLEYLNFVDQLMAADEQVYANVNLAAVESLLRLESTGYEAVGFGHLRLPSYGATQSSRVGRVQGCGTATGLAFRRPQVSDCAHVDTQ